MSAPTYALPPHVFLCPVAGGIVFLDIRKDRYCGISGEEAQCVAPIVKGWPGGDSPAASDGANLQNARRIAERLTAEGLFVQTGVPSKSATPVAVPRIETLGAPDLPGARRRIRALDVVRFVSACTRAKASLRWKPFEAVVTRAVERKRKAAARRGNADLHALAEAVAVFRILRVYMFTAKEMCLFHSLALSNFLAYYGFFPTWVMGVKTAPFAAHSWVQFDQFVLDSSPEEAQFYVPIMAV